MAKYEVKVDSTDNKLKTDDITIQQDYTLPKATTSVLGGVKVGNGLQADANGVLTLNRSTMDLGDVEVTDNTDIVTSHATVTTNNTIYKRKATLLYSYIKNKLMSVFLGKNDNAVSSTSATNDKDGNDITTTYYKKTDKVATAVLADKATADGNNRNIVNTYATKSEVNGISENLTSLTEYVYNDSKFELVTDYYNSPFNPSNPVTLIPLHAALNWLENESLLRNKLFIWNNGRTVFLDVEHFKQMIVSLNIQPNQEYEFIFFGGGAVFLGTDSEYQSYVQQNGNLPSERYRNTSNTKGVKVTVTKHYQADLTGDRFFTSSCEIEYIYFEQIDLSQFSF